MRKNKRKKIKLKIIHDIIPPHLVENVILAEKKVSKMVRVAYLFLRTSKYGSAALVLGVAFLGGAIIMGFSSKIERVELFSTQCEGDWQNMETALDRDLSDKATALEFNHSNSASVVGPKEEIYGEFSSDDDIIPPPDAVVDADEDIDVESKEIENLMEDTESIEENEIDSPAQEEINLPVEQEDPVQNIEPVEETETETEQSTVSDPLSVPDIQSPEPPESLEEEFSFLKKTKSVFFIPEARANEIDESAVDESINNEMPAQNEIENEEMQGLDQRPEPTREISNGEALTQNENIEAEEVQEDQILEEMVQIGDTEPTETETEEKFEDYSGMISIPDVDGNFFSETQDQNKTIEEPQTIFTKGLNVVYSDFPIPEKSGGLKKIRVGFSFASFGEENEDDEIIVSWSSDNENWNNISEFVLNKSYSNKSNGGYFYTDFFDSSDLEEDEVLEWKDIENIKIKFAYLTNNNENNYIPFFLDAVWLETEAEKLDEELNEEEKRIKILSHKKDFRINEDLEFVFKYKKEKRGFLNPLISIGEALGVVDYWGDINITAEIIGPNGKIFKIPSEEFGDSSEIFTLDKNGEILMKLKNNKKFKPGLYKIILKVEENGETQTLEQDFTWGVLAINANKSIYLPSEKAYLQMGVLRNDGHTICDAGLELRIKNYELGIETLLSTEDGTIEYSGQCSGNNVTDVPDYFAYYEVRGSGTYEMKLTNLDNGYEITDSFEVRKSVPFEVERIGPSRIYPPADYEMILKVKANENFSGFIQEKIPALFVIMNQELRIKNQETEEFEIYGGQFITQDGNDNTKLLRWHNIDLKQNDELEIKYIFDAPDVSPDLHLLGPLGFYE